MSLLFDPFLQQLVVYPNRLTPSSDKPTFVRAERYEARSDEGLPLPSIVDLQMKAAVYQGVFNIKDDAEQGATHTCSTGNCTWDAFSSLAICSACDNITSYIDRTCQETGCHTFSLPNGPLLSGGGSQINSSITNISSALSQTPSVLRFSALISKRTDDAENAFALECAMWYCVNEYTVSVTDGVVNQSTRSSWRNDSALPSQSSDLEYSPPDFFANDAKGNNSFTVSNLAAMALNSFMSESFTGSGGLNESGSAFSSDVMQALYNTQSLAVRIENLATSMTNNIRQHDCGGSDPAVGIAWETSTYVHVRWAWFAFPVALVVLSLVLLLGTIIETSNRDVMIWKSNSLATLFHGRGLKLDPSDHTTLNKLSEMAQKAKNVKVELTQTSEGDWKLVQM